MGHRILAAVATAFLQGSAALAQGTVPPADAASHVRPEAGAVGAIGVLGRVGAFRVGGQVNEKFAVDLTLGRIDGFGRNGDGAHGFSIGGQVRWLWRGRGPSGRSGYWLAGPQVVQTINRTEVRYPDRPTAFFVDTSAFTTLQVGYGWDVLMKNGARAGVEVSTGGNEGGPSTCANVFIVWGPKRR